MGARNLFSSSIVTRAARASLSRQAKRGPHRPFQGRGHLLRARAPRRGRKSRRSGLALSRSVSAIASGFRDSRLESPVTPRSPLILRNLARDGNDRKNASGSDYDPWPWVGHGSVRTRMSNPFARAQCGDGSGLYRGYAWISRHKRMRVRSTPTIPRHESPDALSIGLRMVFGA